MSLADYLNSVLGGLASQLGWSVVAGNSYDFIVSETLEKYGVVTEIDATDTNKLHALGKVCLWKQVLIEVSFDYSFSADGATYNRNQLYEMIKQNYADALADASQYDPNNLITVGTVTTEQNPYQVFPPYNERSK